MENWYSADLCEEARKRSRGNDITKLSAIHAGVSAGVALTVTLLQFWLEKGIANTGGLSGMGMRSVLQTAATLLSGANSMLTPFWVLGFWYAALLWAREQHARPGDLLMGLRRFWGYLGLLLYRGILVFSVALVSVYASSFLYMATPWAEPVMDFAQSVNMDMEAAGAAIAQMSVAQMDALLETMVPMVVIWAILLVVLLVPMLYKFRLAEFFLLEDRRVSALRAMISSSRCLRKRRFKLFLLDLRFWWYYALHLLCLGVYSADLWLPLLGVSVPEGVGTLLVLYALYLLALFAMQTFLQPRVQTAYALAYEQLRQLEPVMPKQRPMPKNLPWDEA